jgi:hypothetical protein
MISPPELYFEDPGGSHFQLELGSCRREDVEAVPGTERQQYLKEMATLNIKRLSHTGKKKIEFRSWVGENFPSPMDMTKFVHRIPIVVVSLIARGVTKFVK